MLSTLNPPTLFMGKDHHHLPGVPSTNDFLKQISREKKLTEGHTVSTSYQTSGRGQIGNFWESERDQNILMSVFLLPRSLPAGHFFYLNMSVCLALTDTLNYFHSGFKIKWPNDILFDGKKVAGVLIENVMAKDLLQQSIVGIGMNVNQQDFKFQGNPAPTSLSSIVGKKLDLSFVMEQLLKNLEARYLQLMRSHTAHKAEYLEMLYGFDQEVKVEWEGKAAPGKVEDVLPDGTLIMRIDGTARKFQFKKVRFLF